MSTDEDSDIKIIGKLALNIYPQVLKKLNKEIDSPAKYFFFVSVCVEEAILHLSKSRFSANSRLKMEATLSISYELAILLLTDSKITPCLFSKIKNYSLEIIEQMIESLILGSLNRSQLQQRRRFKWFF